MKSKILLLILLISFKTAFSQDYKVSSLAPELLEKAHAIVRLNETKFIVKNAGEAEESVKRVITILDENGNNHATEIVHYNKLNKLKNFEGRIYDADGKKVKSLKKDDITDVAAWSAGTIHGDSRMKIGDFSYNKYPFTVEFEYEIETKNMMFYPQWFPRENEGTAIQNATLKIVMPNNLALRFKEMNKIEKGTETILPTGMKEYNWTIRNQKVTDEEPMSSPWASMGPGVLAAPTDFEVEGYQGKMTSWKEYGLFLNELSKGRDILDAKTTEKIKIMVANIQDPKEKVKKIYEYLQSHVRYVSIQLGIGGWQPFQAQYVADNGYGDCKALSNYTKAMLKTVGIPSHYAVIYGGDQYLPLLEDFPASYFNHAVLCVPMPQDTIWLECTSQTNSFGYQGDFTGDRKALIITDEGGKLVNTTKYKAKDNLLNRNVNIKIGDDGNAQAEVSTKYTGIQQDSYEQQIHGNTAEDQKKWLYAHIGIPSFEITNFQFKQQKGFLPSVDEKLSLSVNKFANKSGQRFFINPNLLNQNKSVPNLVENRKSDFVIYTSFLDTDSVNIDFPQNYVLESMFNPTIIDSPFGTYEAKVTLKEGKLIYTRKMQLERGTYPASMYKNYIDFKKKVVKADKAQVVLINKT